MFRFLIIFISIFFLTISFSYAKTFTYYKGFHQFVYNTCYSSESAACSDFASKITNATTSLAACQTNSNIVQASFTSYSYNSEGVLSPNTGPLSSFAEAKTHVCGENEKLELNGCDTSCVPDNTCQQKSGQQIHQRRQCGIASGTNCQTTATPDSGDSSTIHCDSYAINWLDLNGTGTSDGECELNISAVNRDPKGNGNFDAGDTPQSPSGPVAIYCDVTSTYTGQPAQTGTNAPPSSPPTNPSNPTTSTGIKPNSGTGTGTGSCPDGSNPVNGTCAMGGECANGAAMVNGVCPSGTGNQTGTGTCTVGTAGCSSTGTCTVGTSGCSSTGTCSAGAASCTGTCTVGTAGCTNAGTGGGSNGGTCDPTKSICDGSGDGSAATGGLTKPTKIENTVTESWWESEYEDGIVGIWDSHKTALNNTPFIQSLNQFKQGIPNTGSCPSFQLTFMQYSGSISPPCLIWPFLRAVFLFSTMMVCRRIVFGG